MATMKLDFDGDNPTSEINSAFLGAFAEGSRVDVVFLGCGEVPTESQLAEVRRLDSGVVDLFEPLGKALIAEWNSRLRINPEFFAAFDPLDSIDNLIECASVHTVYVHPEDAEGVCLGLGGEWELDEEHGFGVLLLNQRVLEVGYEDLAFSFDTKDSECKDEVSIRQRIDAIHEMLRNIEAHNDRQNQSIQGFEQLSSDSEKLDKLRGFLGKFGGVLGRFGLQDMFEKTTEKMLQSIPDQAQQAILRNRQRVDTLREELALLEQKLQALHATGEGEKP